MRISKSLIIIVFIQIITAHTLKNFMEQHFNKETVVIISFNFRNWNKFVQSLLNEIRPKIITNPQNFNKMATTSKNYIIVEDTPEILNASLEKLLYNIDHKGRFLIIFQNNLTEDDVRTTFKTLWNYYIHNTVIVTNSTNFHTWYPYNSENHCGSTINLVTNPKSLNMFAHKIPPTFNGCNVSITWNNFSYAIRTPQDRLNPGFAIRSLETIAELLKIRINYLSENTNYFHENSKVGSYETLTEDMTTRKIDLGFVIIGLTHRLSNKVQLLKPFFKSKYYFVFPPRKKIHASQKMFAIFSATTWSVIFVSFVAMTFVWKYLNRVSLPSSFFFVFQMSFQSVCQPKEMVFRLVFLLFVLYVTYLSWFYLGKMSSILTRPSYEPKIKKIDDIIRSDKRLIFKTMFERYLATFGNQTFENLIKRRIEDSNEMHYYEIIENFVRRKDHGIIMAGTDLAWIKNWESLEIVYRDEVRR